MKILPYILFIALTFSLNILEGSCMEHKIDLESLGFVIERKPAPRNNKTSRLSLQSGFEDWNSGDEGSPKEFLDNKGLPIQLMKKGGPDDDGVDDSIDLSSGVELEVTSEDTLTGKELLGDVQRNVQEPVQEEEVWVGVSLKDDEAVGARPPTPDPKADDPLRDIEDLGLIKEDLQTKPTALEEFFKGFNWQQPKDSKGRLRALSPELRTKMIGILQGQYANQLSLNYCDTLDPKLFRQFHIRYITHLTLQGCPWVNGKMVAELPEQCTGLCYFDGSRCYNLERFAGKFSTLRTLKLNGCFTLKKVTVKADKPPLELMRRQRQLLSIRYRKKQDNMELDNARKEYGLKHVELKENGALEKFSLETNSLRTALFDHTPLISDPMLDTFAKTCPDLETLSCDKCPGVARPDLRKLFPKLIHSSFGPVNLEEIRRRLQNEKLHYLALTQLMPTAMRSFSYFSDLATLIVEDSHMTDEGAFTIARLLHLKDLDLSNNKIGPRGARMLFLNPSITTLNLRKNKLGKEGALLFQGNVTIKTLNVAENDIGDEGVVGFSNCSIKDLDLSFNNISEIGAVLLRGFNHIELLTLRGNPIGSNGSKAISEMLNLQHLNLKGCQVGDGACWFRGARRLRYLDLRDNDVKDKGALALSYSKSIIYLDLGRNGITCIGVSQFDDNTVLTNLKLKHNRIGKDGAQKLAKNTTLTVLVLTDNPIGEEGYLAFKTSPNDNLRMLYKHYSQDNTLWELENQ